MPWSVKTQGRVFNDIFLQVRVTFIASAQYAVSVCRQFTLSTQLIKPNYLTFIEADIIVILQKQMSVSPTLVKTVEHA